MAVPLLLSAAFVLESTRATAFMQLQPNIVGGSLNVRGVTDLPDGTKIVFSVVPGDSTDAALGAPYEDGSAIVTAGTFEQVVDISRFPSGPITVWAAFDPAPDQPAEAMRRFGPDQACEGPASSTTRVAAVGSSRSARSDAERSLGSGLASGNVTWNITPIKPDGERSPRTILAPMTPAELDEFAASYFRDWEVLRSGSRAERIAFEHAAGRPSDALTAMLMDEPTKPDVAWAIIQHLIEHAPDDAARSFVAAGPLEDLIQHHGVAFGDQIVDQARRDPRLRQALGDVWGWEHVPEPLRGRLLKLADPKT